MELKKTVTTLAMAVSVIDSATSARAKLEIKLEVAPPGQKDMSMTPTHSSGGCGKINKNINATVGRSIS